MSFNLKHYVTIALGTGVAFAYGMHVQSGSEQPVAFHPASQEFQPMTVAPVDPQPDPWAYGEAARLPGPRSVSRNEASMTPSLPDRSQWNSQWDLEETVGAAYQSPGGKSQEWVASPADCPVADPSTLAPPEMAAPAIAAPEAGSLEMSAPEVASSEFAHPELVAREMASPDLVEAEVNLPGLVAPEIFGVAKAGDDGSDEFMIALPVDATRSDRGPPLIQGPRSADSLPMEQDAEFFTGEEPGTESTILNAPGDVVESANLVLPLVESAAIQAVHHIEYGKSLSRRGATFAARQEFFSALRVISEANDVRLGDARCSKALRRAILAMKEAEDFVVHDTESQIALDVAGVVGAHRSDVLSQAQVDSMTLNQAMQEYFRVAQQQLDLAGGRNAVTAEALYCLGKLYTVNSSTQLASSSADLEKAIVYHLASLMSDRSNFRSASELGVLMAQMGRLEDAKELFRQSLGVRQTPQTWSNLAAAHRRSGEIQLARQADQEAVRSAQSQSIPTDASIHWLPKDAFNDSAARGVEERVASRIESTGNLPFRNSRELRDSGRENRKLDARRTQRY